MYGKWRFFASISHQFWWRCEILLKTCTPRKSLFTFKNIINKEKTIEPEVKNLSFHFNFTCLLFVYFFKYFFLLWKGTQVPILNFEFLRHRFRILFQITDNSERNIDKDAKSLFRLINKSTLFIWSIVEQLKILSTFF